jgi:FAD/FMN-containing dehydrogenase
VIEHGYDNDLKYAMRASGGSFGIVTEFVYKMYPKPETLSCLLLVSANCQSP